VREVARRVLVTGASGFIGRAAVSALQARGFDVHGVSRHAVDLLDADAVDALFADLEDIAHYQIRQQADGTLEIFLMPVAVGEDLTASAALLGSRLTALLGGEVTVRTGVMIAPEDSGKFRLTVRLG